MQLVFAIVTCGGLLIGGSTIGAAQDPPAQSKEARPDFSGTWTSYRMGNPEGAANTRGGLQVGPGRGLLIIVQDAESVSVVERYSVGPDNKVEYRLNGQMVRNQFRLALTTVPSEVTSQWKGDTLVSSIAVFVPGEAYPRRYKQTLSLNSSGFLAVRDEDDSGNARTIIYRKAEPPIELPTSPARDGNGWSADRRWGS